MNKVYIHKQTTSTTIQLSHTCIHTYMHTYIHTYIYLYLHIHIRTETFARNIFKIFYFHIKLSPPHQHRLLYCTYIHILYILRTRMYVCMYVCMQVQVFRIKKQFFTCFFFLPIAEKKCRIRFHMAYSFTLSLSLSFSLWCTSIEKTKIKNTLILAGCVLFKNLMKIFSTLSVYACMCVFFVSS